MTAVPVLCPVCGARPSGKLPYLCVEFGFLDGAENIFSDSQILVCGSCTFSFVHPPIADEVLSRFYRDVYRGDKRSPFHGAGLCVRRNPSPRDVAQVALGTAFAERVERFLDVGAGASNSFAAVRGSYPACELYSIEEDEYARRLLEIRGVQVLTPLGGHIQLPEEFEGQFDLILMSHVLEHFGGQDVTETLTQVAKLLSPGGVLVVEVPNADLTKFADARTDDSPHLSFFSKKALALTVEKAGMRVVFNREVGALRREGDKSDRGRIFMAWWQGWQRLIKRLAVKGIIPKPLYCGLLALRGLFRPAEPMWRDPNFQYDEGRECIRLVAAIR